MTETQPEPATAPEAPDTAPSEEEQEGERYDGGEIPHVPDTEPETEQADED